MMMNRMETTQFTRWSRPRPYQLPSSFRSTTSATTEHHHCLRRLLEVLMTVVLLLPTQVVDAWMGPAWGAHSHTRFVGIKSSAFSRRTRIALKEASSSSSSSSVPPPPPPASSRRRQSRSTRLVNAEQVNQEETPAGIAGAEFFGGNRQKEEFFDAAAEASATALLLDAPLATAAPVAVMEEEEEEQKMFVTPTLAGRATTTKTTHQCRLDDPTAFPDTLAAQLARDVQQQINAVLYQEDYEHQQQQLQLQLRLASSGPAFFYAAQGFVWQPPGPAVRNAAQPLEALAQALDFYRQVHLAITSARTVSSPDQLQPVVQLRWELSLVWPTLWEPRVLLTGQSWCTLRLAENSNAENSISIFRGVILQQIDQWDAAPDLLATLAQQLVPRFWDIYHIGMTPSAEISPRFRTLASSTPPGTALTSTSSPPATLPRPRRWWPGYEMAELPSRWTLQATLTDWGTREDANALILPNHAFSCVIKTMGPTRQRYVPVAPLQVQIMLPPWAEEEKVSTDRSNRLVLQWQVPLAVEFQSQLAWLLPGPDPEAHPDSQPDSKYVWQPPRRVATVPFDGHPQDVEIAAVRQRLYEQVVVRDGFQPKLDATGRPIFFFWQHAVKACYTEEGLGMMVYEWRPGFTRSNSVGIELEL